MAEKKDNLENGSFLRDLEKLEEEPSYETICYNVYGEEISNSNILEDI